MDSAAAWPSDPRQWAAALALLGLAARTASGLPGALSALALLVGVEAREEGQEGEAPEEGRARVSLLRRGNVISLNHKPFFLMTFSERPLLFQIIILAAGACG